MNTNEKMSKSYYQEGKDAEKKQKQKELLAYWSTEQTYEWFGTETPNYQLIEAIVLKYQGISSTSIVYLYNKRQTHTIPLNEHIIDHIINTCNMYKCTFGIRGEFEKKEDLWHYNISPLCELEINRSNPYMNDRKHKTKEYILSLEKRIKELENEIVQLKTVGVSK